MRSQIQINGTVQGVGFRPYVFGLASKNDLKGRVQNNQTGVFVDLEGGEYEIQQFIDALKTNPPPLSWIESISRQNILQYANFTDFQIVASVCSDSKSVPISADIATCSGCLREMLDPHDRRFRYPFINCTNCGPRFTIIENVPYDRAQTTMREFEMCTACRAEYEDPSNRRFHAEPTCCPECGPRVVLSVPPALADGLRQAVHDAREIDARRRSTASATRRDPVRQARQLIESGKILAIKGIGGYHLVCDALNSNAVEALRKRKYREDKPFALMANSIDIIEGYCIVSESEKELLLSPERPIVLLKRRINTLPTGHASAFTRVPEAIAPRMNTLGFMLPYTPLHYLLLENLAGPLIMTSGNVSDEPIAYTDRDASERLGNIADYYLTHNRRIHIWMDDSVVRWQNRPRKRVARTAPRIPLSRKDLNRTIAPPADAGGSAVILRRSRGYAPAPIKTSFKFTKQILACGAELKTTFCLTRDNYAFVSHHIGDLKNLETLNSFTDGIDHYKRLFNLEPEIIAYDLHPEYLSTKYAHSGEEIETKIGVQHHHAHIASCLADNGAEGEVIGVAMDGLGFGTDGKLWGGEFFVADFVHAERIAHLDYVPMPGGAKAIREPWRLAAVYLQRAFGDEFLNLDLPFVKRLDRDKWSTMASMIATKTNSPETSSMGRLFDAVSALLGIREVVNYEGQAAIELEAAADSSVTGAYHFELASDGIIVAESVIRAAVADILDGRPVGEVSARFHVAVANLIADLVTNVGDNRHLTRVALSGGVFQNMFLLNKTCGLLEGRGFEVLTHSRVPTNDGGISLGQAAIANAKFIAGNY